MGDWVFHLLFSKLDMGKEKAKKRKRKGEGKEKEKEKGFYSEMEVRD